MIPLISNGVAVNPGPLINYIDGITGVAAGGLASVNMPVNERAHGYVFYCSAVNYTGSTTAQTTTHVTGSGNDDLTAHITVNSTGVPTAATVNAGGTGYTTGDKVIIADATGTGQQWTVTASGGVVSALALVANTATASPINPASLISIAKLSVGGTPMRDIDVLYTLMIGQANGYNSKLGELPFFFSEPWRDKTRANVVNSWDLFGQSSCQVTFQINAGYQLATITGQRMFDGLRNQITVNGQTIPNLEPISHHKFTYPVAGSTAGTITPVTIIPFSYPISRIWMIGSTPGAITALELLADGQKRLEATVAQLNGMYADRGFQFGQANYANQNQTSQKPLGFNPINYFDTAFISDPDQRYGKALRAAKNLTVRVTSTATQTVTFVVEALPGAYAG